uniref:M67 family metallopeptidase n=1 Tax=uncultured Erythrobacter sp. TaxID=263913 RepID=UPI00262D2B73|nr:M67 family metallopeptidase [uncultured Erythrobacter sp.]
MQLKQTKNGDLPVPTKVYRQLLDAALAAHPLECCGLLLGRAGRITVVRECANVHPTPQSHFEIDPQALIDAHKVEREGGLRLMGYFHSHPKGDPHPSETDKAMAAHDGKVWAIIADSGMMFWVDGKDRFHALSYDVGNR